MIQRQVLRSDLATRGGNHTFRATGITPYLKNKGVLKHAQTVANHSSPRTGKLSESRSDKISLDESRRFPYESKCQLPCLRPRGYAAHSMRATTQQQ